MRKPPRPSPAVSDADRALFEEAIGPVRRHVAAEPLHEAPRPAPEPRQFELDEARVLDELMTMRIDPAEMEVGEELSYLREGYRPDVLKRLKRGSYSVQDEIDLHQMTADVARAAISGFLAEAHQRGLHCVKLIHGKGLRSRAAGPVIKRLVDRMLRQRDDVVAFASARAEQGGTGAALVLLRLRK
ncbi:MAG: Smr/MutS family protein [Rhodanobacteraceae bacterium]|nr:Smr/MutS family protein [Rhodanobacteraceae bacterium]